MPNVNNPDIAAMTNKKTSFTAFDSTTPRIPNIEQEQPKIDISFLFNIFFTNMAK